MQRVVVTGASGFIGSHVVGALAERGMQVVATGRDPARLTMHAAHAACMPLDLVSDDLTTLVSGADAVVHCAAMSSPWGRAEHFYAANVEATARLVRAALAAGVQRMVHISSPSIYFQFAHQLGISEGFVPAQCVNEYARTKRLAEACVMQAPSEGLPTIILRPRAVFGERDAAIMPRILQLARRGIFPLPGGGGAQIDVTYVGNVVESIWQALHAGPAACGRAFNITNGVPITVRELLVNVFSALRLRVRFVAVPTNAVLGIAGLLERIANLRKHRPEPRLTRYGIGVLSYSQTLDISAATALLDYRPRWTTAAGIARYADWYRTHGAH